jgi:transposase InsO family protein
MPVQSCNDSDNLDVEEIFHISHFEALPVTSLNSLLDLTIDSGPPHVTTSYGLHTDYSRMSFMKKILNTIPKQIVSDNGPQFTSGEFENFTKQNGIKHYNSAPFHPATNGLGERFVQTFKNSRRAMKQDNKVLSHKIANFLLMDQRNPHGLSPREQMATPMNAVVLPAAFSVLADTHHNT